jgi:dTDP-4-dehydrorhamnose 3,5-epimerase
MKFTRASLSGVWLIELEVREDTRGLFARAYCEDEFAKRNLNTHWPQCNFSVTKRRGTIRGMHFQAEPKPEIKLVRCDVGAIHDVLVDVRRDSPTFGRWECFSLTAENHLTLYVPEGIAHGFQCLEDDSRVFYQMSQTYHPDLARGIRWNDPSVGISWPLADALLSERDQSLPLLKQLSTQLIFLLLSFSSVFDCYRWCCLT